MTTDGSMTDRVASTFSSCVFVLLTRLLAWFHQCQWIYFVTAWICMSALWTLLIKTDYLQRCEEHRRSLERLQGSINFTGEYFDGLDR